MPNRKTEDLRELGVDELAARLSDAEEELANLRFQLGSGQLENTVSVRYARRQVARIKTLIRERELSEQAAGGGE
ncbi:MAG: 50S ribosomal protein L29 [Calditrichaeota bacterium]|nr:50S ribosomal protein L29 [Calditrichota bacterium]